MLFWVLVDPLDALKSVSTASTGRVTWLPWNLGWNKHLAFWKSSSGYALATPSSQPESKLMAAMFPTAKLMLFVQCCVVVLNPDPTPPHESAMPADWDRGLTVREIR